ncbi:MAG: hypothetical protein NUV32_03575 [Exilispira sp.]|jgi:hypothetical protein|nr:hypothetical protein [Exilispira sp.]
MTISIPYRELVKATYIGFVNFPIFHFCKMLLAIDRFKIFFEKYRKKVEDLISDSKFIELYKIYCEYFNIQPKQNIFFFFDFLDELYYLKEPIKNNKHPDFDKYRKGTIFAYSLFNSFTFSFKSLSTKSLYIPIFFHELTHYFQQKSKWNIEEN